MKRLLLLSLLLSAPSMAQAKKGLTVDDMLAMQRISEPTASPDGKLVAFTVRETDLEANRGRTDVWMVRTDGGAPWKMTSHVDGDGSPAFTPDGRAVYFLSSRSGSSQVWGISVFGGEAFQVTKIPLDVNGFQVFPDGKRLLLALDVYVDAATLEDTVKRDEALNKSKVKAKAYDELLFRHWDTWEDGKRAHWFVWDPTTPTKPTDLMKGLDFDSPGPPFGGTEEASINADGTLVAFSAKDAGREAAWSTDSDVFVVDARGGKKPENLTLDAKGAGKGAWDGNPSFSPDGKTLAFLSMKRPKFESDRTRIALIDMATKKSRVITEAWDRSAGELEWSADGKTIFTSADNIGHHALFSVDVASGKEKLLADKGTNQSVVVAGNRIVWAKDTLVSPVELFSAKPDGSDAKPLTAINAARVAGIAWGESEQFSFPGAKGETVYGFAMKPANYKAGKTPVAFLIHGGPQGSFGDHFHYRWNPQAYAGHGYAVVFIDFHGSTGYGQKFTDSISGDWGGAPYEDLMKGLDFALAKYPWMDGSKVAALGASYGGYMINWINGHTDRFKALVCHDGNIDERMAYYDTEELWFPEYEQGGVPWENEANFAKHNPIDFIKNWKTPTLVVHSALDFRVVDTQGMSAFTALRRKNVPARFLWFPDENHWVLKPQNSQRWHSEVLSWIDRYTGHTPPKATK
ncbi:MAG: S9 family peptidase [Deltaproteobacteria bacterium]|nr:S9 family peptidase [Deltaproteobacteria bacterium]